MYGILFQILLFVQRLLMPLVNASINYVSQHFLHFSFRFVAPLALSKFILYCYLQGRYFQCLLISAISSVKLAFYVVCFYVFLFYMFLLSYVMYMLLT